MNFQFPIGRRVEHDDGKGKKDDREDQVDNDEDLTDERHGPILPFPKGTTGVRRDRGGACMQWYFKR